MKWALLAGVMALVPIPAQAGPQFPAVMRGEWCYGGKYDGVNEYSPASNKPVGHCDGSHEDMIITKTHMSNMEDMKCHLIKGLYFRDPFTDEWHGATAIVYLAKLACHYPGRNWVWDVKLWIPARGEAALEFEAKERE